MVDQIHWPTIAGQSKSRCFLVLLYYWFPPYKPVVIILHPFCWRCPTNLSGMALLSALVALASWFAWSYQGAAGGNPGRTPCFQKLRTPRDVILKNIHILVGSVENMGVDAEMYMCIYIYMYVLHLNWCRILFDVFVHLPISYTVLKFLGGIWKYRMIWLWGIFLARGWKIFRWTIWNFGGAGVVPCDSMAWIRRMESKDYLKMLPKRWLSFEKHAGGGCKQVFKNALTQSNWRRSIWSSRSFIQVMQPPLNRKWSPWLWRNLPLDKWILPMLLLQNFVRPLIKLVVRLVLGILWIPSVRDLFAIQVAGPRKETHQADGPKRATLNHPHSDLKKTRCFTF